MRPLIALAAALISLALLAPRYAVAGESEEMAELKRMLRELQTQNRELSRRLGALERERATPAPPQTRSARGPQRPAAASDSSQSWLSRWPAESQERSAAAPDSSQSWLARWPAGAQERSAPGPGSSQPSLARSPRERSTPASAAAQASPEAVGPPVDISPALPEPRDTSQMGLEQRVKELEVAWVAQESATRQIIRDSFSKAGPKINSFLALSGALEFKASRSREFNGPVTDKFEVSTAELDFDIKVSDWLIGSLVLGYETGSGATFPITTLPGAGVDRFTLDRTHIIIGDVTLFPITARVGREVLHFGTSTGVARLDTLSIGTPLTTEVFENRQTAGGLEFAWPTPPLKPPPAPVVVPRVEPLVVAPLVSKWARLLGYKPLPQRIFPPTPVRPPVEPPPFYGSLMVYKGDEAITNSTLMQDFNASLGYRTSGHCGRPYDELRSSLVCPWTLDVHVDYNSSVFNSRFLDTSYRTFLNQIGPISGVAGSVKSSFGPFALVGEVNTVTKQVTFFDALGVLQNITPMTWQVSLGYQFDWNPWVVEIGQQGNYISIAYSGSKDMAGVTDLVNGVPTRVGFVPQHRLFVTLGEWPIDGLRVAVEYSVNWDYAQSAGGTGQVAHGVFGMVQLNF
jgi:hypothetical protein